MMSTSYQIDAHQHFWQIERGDYDWMDDSVSAIRRDIFPPDLSPLIKKHEIDGTVVVQAAASIAETQFILALAERNDFIKGVVGWVDLENSEAANTLDRLLASQFFKGIRPMLQDIPDTAWIMHPTVIANLKKVANRSLRLDALITPRHLEVILQLSEKLPQLQIVIDHCAKPEFTKDEGAQIMWRNGMTKLAERPNVMCKISGLANEAGPDWNAVKLKPYIDHVIETFGPNRLMWGSDWPVLNLVGDYTRWREVSAELLKDLSDQERSAIYGGNAIKFYDLAV
ncbi:MAG: amidohydrolase family protein [Lentilitoribacter sp.]